MDDAMYKFLRERGVTESGIDDLKKDKVIIIGNVKGKILLYPASWREVSFH